MTTAFNLMEIKGCTDLLKNVENLQSHCEFQLHKSGHNFVFPTANFKIRLLRILNDLMDFCLVVSKLPQMKN